MKKLIFFTLVISLISQSHAIAQSRKIAGLVTFNNERQTSTVIKNISSHKQTISDEIGEFTLMAGNGDTLTISKQDFIKDTLLVTAQQYFIIQLKKTPLILKEVIVNSTALTPEQTLAQNKKEYKDIYFKGDKSHIIESIPIGFGLGLSIGINIDKLFSALSKEGKDARRLQRTLIKDYQSSIIDRKFSKAMVARLTGYKGDRLYSFMDKYRPTFQMASKATDYEMSQYVKKKLTEDRNLKS
jgi:hypothetical protein